MLPPPKLRDPRRQINQHHGYGAEGLYLTRRRWDYFVRYLLGAEPARVSTAPAGTGARNVTLSIS